MCYISSPLSFRALRPLLYLCPRHPLLLEIPPCTVATTVYRTCTECIQHTVLLLMILGLLVVVYIFFPSTHVFPALIICPWRFRSEDFHLVRTRPLSPPKNTPLCVHTSMAGSSLSSPDKDNNACQLGPPGPWYSPITICCIDISRQHLIQSAMLVASSAVTYQSV